MQVTEVAEGSGPKGTSISYLSDPRAQRSLQKKAEKFPEPKGNDCQKIGFQTPQSCCDSMQKACTSENQEIFLAQSEWAVSLTHI